LLWNPVVASHESGVIRFANALQHQNQAKSTTNNIQIRQNPGRYTAMHAGNSAGKKRAPTIFSLRSLLPAPQRGGPLLPLFFSGLEASSTMRQRSQTAAAAAAALGVAVLLLVVALPAERGSSRRRIVLEYE